MIAIAAVGPLSKRHFGISHFVLCREVVLFLEVKNLLMVWERGPKECPLLEGCPFLGGSFGSSTVTTELITLKKERKKKRKKERKKGE